MTGTWDHLRQEFAKLVYVVTHASKLTYASWGVGLVVAILYFKLIFLSGCRFAEDVRNIGRGYWLKYFCLWPFRWLLHYEEIQWSKIKVFVWIALSVGSGVLAYHQLPQWFPNVFK